MRFILTRNSDLVPDISLVGSAGGNLTIAACCLETCGVGVGGAATLGGGGDWDTCGGGDVGVGAGAASGVTDSVAFGVSSTLGVSLAGAGAPSKEI